MVDTQELDHEIIYLQSHESSEHDGRLWCEDSIFDDDTKYIRHDLYESLSLQLEAATKAKDGAYWERNQLVAVLTKVFPAWREKHPDSDIAWEDDWRNIVFIELPTGQTSWHIHDSEYDSFKDLPQSAHGICSWDGHTTEEKYARLAKLTKEDI